MRLTHCLPLLFALAAAPAFAQAGASAEEKREKSIKLPEILNALSIAPGSHVADIGAGEGFFTARMARVVGSTGRVFAVDIDDQQAIPALKKLVEKQSLDNVTVIHNKPDDPQLPSRNLDAALMVITYHEIEPYREMLAHVLESLKAGGRLVVVDNMPRKTKSRPRAEQVKNHAISPDVAEAEFRAAGFEIVLRQDSFIDRPDEEDTKWMIVCRRPVQ